MAIRRKGKWVDTCTECDAVVLIWEQLPPWKGGGIEEYVLMEDDEIENKTRWVCPHCNTRNEWNEFEQES